MRIIVNENIILRDMELDDAQVLFDIIDNNREKLITWLPFVGRMRTLADEESFVRAVLSLPDENREEIFVIEYDNEVCGLIGFLNTEEINHRTEVGYWLSPEYWHKGIMSRCANAVYEYAVRELKMNRVMVRCAVGNERSNAIPRRLGFMLEGTERAGERMADGSYADLNVWSKLANEL